MERFGTLLQKWLAHLFDYYDLKDTSPYYRIGRFERIYHTFLLNLSICLCSHWVEPNGKTADSDYQYPCFELMLIPKNTTDVGVMGIVIELKTREEKDTEKEIEESLNQMNRLWKQDYTTKLRDRNITKILGVSLHLQGKFAWGKSLALSDFPYSSQSFSPS